jgi:plastocyanin
VATSVEIPKGAGTGPSAAPGYAPDTITVVIGVNNTVTWTNDDTVAHTVTSVSGNGTVSSGNFVPGATYTYTFTAPGTYDYYCEYHAWMTGTVIVKSG